jgi:hypothetical protein
MAHQLANMAMLYAIIGLLNRRARRAGHAAARQEEVLLGAAMALAIANLLASLRADNASDYVYMSYFLIATTTFLKLRWWVLVLMGLLGLLGLTALGRRRQWVWWGLGGAVESCC